MISSTPARPTERNTRLIRQGAFDSSAPLDPNRQLFAACSELEVEESNRLSFAGPVPRWIGLSSRMPRNNLGIMLVEDWMGK